MVVAVAVVAVVATVFALVCARTESFLFAVATLRYVDTGWWGDRSLHEIVRERAAADPHGAAFKTLDTTTSWQAYDALADDLAGALVALGLPEGDRVAVQLPDTVLVHAALVATARAGLVAVGIGARAGEREMAHLIRKTGARTLVSVGERGPRPTGELVAHLLDAGVPLDFHIVLAESGVVEVAQVSPRRRTILRPGCVSREEVELRSFGPNDLSLLNSTSGTTGLPKCVTQFDNRWIAFSRLAIEAGELGAGEVFLGAVPAPFGFGLWTSHYAPALLGSPTVVMTKFNVEDMIRLIQRVRVTVLCCVSTQFRMLLNSPLANEADLSSLRVMFTGGEAVPYDRAAEFEERTGASVLQFFGSNETGALSYTTLRDPRAKRLTTAGRLIPDMQVRLFDGEGRDVTSSGGPGQPGGVGPLTCGGYYDDVTANQQLYTTDGWMLMGDLVTLDEDGYLSVVGRTSDIIIRGGKNISAAQVEQEVESHPAVDLASVVAVPDPLYGERVCAVVSLRPGCRLELSNLVDHLSERNVSKELYPEHLVVLAGLPRSSGGKVAKDQVRTRALESLASSR